ncbi:MAG: SusD/RagB family nutrient-binding outer membrane lipoprotein, partial [Bacteroidota bacterium]
MKRNFISSLLFATLVLFSTSCGDFGDINIDPNNTTSVAPEVLLSSALRSVASVEGAAIGALYSQHMAETQYSDASRYLDVNFDFNGWYTGPLADLNHIIELNTDEATAADALVSGSNANQIAVARILKAYF